MSSDVDARIADVLKKRGIKAAPTAAKENPIMSKIRDVAATAPGTRRFASDLGMMGAGGGVGATLGTMATPFVGPEAIPAAEIAGEGAGYAGSQTINDFIDKFGDRQPLPKGMDELKSFPGRMATGMTIGTLGKYVAKPVVKGAVNAVKKAAPAVTEFAASIPQKLTKFLQDSGMTAKEFFNKFPGTQERLEQLASQAKGSFDKAQLPAQGAGKAIGKAKVNLGMRGATPQAEALRVAAAPKTEFGPKSFQDLNKRFAALNQAKPGPNQDPRGFLPEAIKLKGQIQDSIHVREAFTPGERAHLGELAKVVDGWVKEISPKYKALETNFSRMKPAADEAANMAEKFERPVRGADVLRNAAPATRGIPLENLRQLQKVNPDLMNEATGSVTSEQFNRALPKGRLGKLAIARAPATVAGGLLASKSSKRHPVAASMAGVASMLAMQSPRVLAELITRAPQLTKLLMNPAFHNAISRAVEPGVQDVLGTDQQQ